VSAAIAEPAGAGLQLFAGGRAFNAVGLRAGVWAAEARLVQLVDYDLRDAAAEPWSCGTDEGETAGCGVMPLAEWANRHTTSPSRWLRGQRKGAPEQSLSTWEWLGACLPDRKIGKAVGIGETRDHFGQSRYEFALRVRLALRTLDVA
jgi:hypothetical protein